MERLENSRWGFESNCFVCEANPDGLGIEFFADVDDGQELHCKAEVSDGDGVLCATASAAFVPLGPAQALDALGATVTGEDASYVRGGESTVA